MCRMGLQLQPSTPGKMARKVSKKPAGKKMSSYFLSQIGRGEGWNTDCLGFGLGREHLYGLCIELSLEQLFHWVLRPRYWQATRHGIELCYQHCTMFWPNYWTGIQPVWCSVKSWSFAPHWFDFLHYVAIILNGTEFGISHPAKETIAV